MVNRDIPPPVHSRDAGQTDATGRFGVETKRKGRFGDPADAAVGTVLSPAVLAIGLAPGTADRASMVPVLAPAPPPASIARLERRAEGPNGI